jgi:hypothetical protein
LQKNFDIIRHGIWDLLKKRGRVQQRLVFPKLKLDDFTSGFRTRYADTAGGWEEVVAMGGGIRTGAGTGVELDKQNEADVATEGKTLAGGAAAEQANRIWLISGEKMTLNFL